jgi:hypothetical protein
MKNWMEKMKPCIFPGLKMGIKDIYQTLFSIINQVIYYNHIYFQFISEKNNFVCLMNFYFVGFSRINEF